MTIIRMGLWGRRNALGRRIRSLAALWKSRRDARRARWALVKMLPSTSFPLTVAVVLAVVLYIASQTVSMIAAGVLVGSVPRAARDGLHSPAGHRVVLALVVVGAIFLYQEVVIPFENLAVGVLTRKVDGRLRLRVMRATNEPVGIAHLEDPATLDLIRDAQGLGEAQYSPGGALSAMVSIFSTRLASFAAAGLVATYRWWLAVLLFGYASAVRYVLTDDMSRKAESSRNETEEFRRAEYLYTMAMGLEAGKEVRVFGLGSFVVGRFRSHWSGAMHWLWEWRKAEDTAAWAWSLPWGALLFGAWFVLGRDAMAGSVSLQTVVTIAPAMALAGSVRLSGDDAQLAWGASTVPAVVALEAAVRPHVGGPAKVDTSRAAAARLPRREIRFEGVCFRYSGQADDVLHGTDLVIPAGTSVAIVGVNGAGKTTLVKLLARLYEPTAGRITVDGIDVRAIDAHLWRGQIAAIFQDFLHFQLTARDNVALGGISRQWTDAELSAIAAKVGALGIIDALPRGWDTVLSRQFTAGTELSGGQWQRIALARAMCAVEAGARILVLDEPTANLDVRAEAELFDRFLDITRGLTTILISHRFSSVRHADRILVLDHGRIIESGSHAELVAAGGSYAHMFSLQAARFLTDNRTAEIVDGADA